MTLNESFELLDVGTFEEIPDFLIRKHPLELNAGYDWLKVSANQEWLCQAAGQGCLKP